MYSINSPKLTSANMSKKQFSILLLFVTSTIAFATAAFNDNQQSDKMLLSDLKVITLHQGRMTNARRSSPVPQLKCVGGSAQHKFQPKVVQCTNQGSDGYDIQWECKTDMDNAYRFGHVGVSCEGYDYPNDPFVLKGSCGLEYTIEFTEEGHQREKSKSKSYSYNYDSDHQSTGGAGGLVIFFAILIVIVIIYKVCLEPNTPRAYMNSHANPTAPPQPPPYGFRPEFTSGQGTDKNDFGAPPPYESTHTGFAPNPPPYGNQYASSSSTHRNNNDDAGFWTGAATGGVLGYLFGSSGNRGHRHNNHWNSHGHSNYGFGNSDFSSSSRSPPSPKSSGSRTASGFGGTSRR